MTTAWMETFCFLCSVRLGVIVICFVSLIESAIPLIYLMVIGSGVIQLNFFDAIEANAEIKKHVALRLMGRIFRNDGESLYVFLITNGMIYIVCCILAIIGAIKLYKWFLLPFIWIEFTRFIVLLVIHVVSMILLKKKLNLGELIAVIVIGAFALVFIGYMWSGVVAFYQILRIIETDKYKSLYGEDPFISYCNSMENLPQHIENVRMYRTPNFDQLTPLKNNEKAPNITNNKRQPPASQKVAPFLLSEKNVATIQMNEPDMKLAMQQFQNWYGHELAVVRKSKLMRFS